MTRSLFVFLATSWLFLASCTNDPSPGELGSGAQARAAFVDVLITGAPVDDLFAFRADIVEVRLVRDDGSETENLLAGPLSLEFLGLRGSQAFLASGQVPAGSYAALRVIFATDTLGARDQEGTRVRVEARSDELLARLPMAVTIAGEDYARLRVDLDLATSIRGNVQDGVVDFEPQGRSVLLPAGRLFFDALQAQVVARNLANGTLEVQGFADEDGKLSLGNFTVLVDVGTVLIDTLGFAQPQPAFFLSALTPQATWVEIRGSLEVDGVLRAERIEIEAQDGVPGSIFPVKLDGVVTGILPQGFVLQLRSVERGGFLADPVLAALGDPASLVISVDARTRVFPGDQGVSSGTAALSVGQSVDAKFQIFPGEPFPSLRVGIRTRGADPDASGTF